MQCYGRAELQSELFEVQETPLLMLKAPGIAARGSAEVCSRPFFFKGGGMTHSVCYNSAKVTC